MAQKAAIAEEGITIQLSMHLPMKIIKKKRLYVSCCPILDVYSQGDTAEEAKHNLIEAITLFAISCFERGTLEEVLKDCGFTTRPGTFTYPKNDSPTDYIDVPIPMFVSDAARCHA